MDASNDPSRNGGQRSPALSRGKRHLLLLMGWICVGLGVLGIVMPVMPGVVFLIVAAWAFARSSQRFQYWLYNHPVLGPPVVRWYAHGVIPTNAKIASITTMTGSLAVLAIFVAKNWIMPAIVGAIMAGAAVYIVTRPSRPPLETAE